MWFESWDRSGATLVVLVITYGCLVLVLVLRLSGKRTLAKLNAFDFVVTIALGSTLATVVVSRQVPLAEGVLALLGFVAMQFVVARTTVGSSWFDRMVKASPTAMVVAGRLHEDAMRRCRLRADELAAALRKQGYSSHRDVDLVVLETDGTISVVAHVDDWDALEGVEGVAEASPQPSERGGVADA